MFFFQNMLAVRLKKFLYLIFSFNLSVYKNFILYGLVPSYEHKSFISSIEKPDLIIDIGLNKGQFTSFMNLYFKDSKIIGFEPLSEDFAIAEKALKSHNNINIYQYAIGDKKENKLINISKSSDSSSFLPQTPLQSEIFGGTEPSLIQEETKIRTIDSFDIDFKSSKKALLKIDVQGYELKVLRGMKNKLKEIGDIYVECSFIELYKDQCLYDDIKSYLSEHNFFEFKRYNEHYYNNKIVQADIHFKKSFLPNDASKPEINT